MANNATKDPVAVVCYWIVASISILLSLSVYVYTARADDSPPIVHSQPHTECAQELKRLMGLINSLDQEIQQLKSLSSLRSQVEELKRTITEREHEEGQIQRAMSELLHEQG